MNTYPKIVESNHYHLWTDALHARALAHQAKNRWDRGTYVRWAVITSWTVLEIACQDALEEPNISYSFKRNLATAVAKKSLPKLDWEKGIWQKVLHAQQLRKNYVHRFISEKDLFPEAHLADEAIETVRDAIKDIYARVGKDSPSWVEDNNDRGWQVNQGTSGNLTVTKASVNESDPDVVRIVYVYDGKEQVSDILPPGIDPTFHVDNLISNVKVPISAVRVYRGDQLVSERSLPMRGT